MQNKTTIIKNDINGTQKIMISNIQNLLENEEKSLNILAQKNYDLIQQTKTFHNTPKSKKLSYYKILIIVLLTFFIYLLFIKIKN